jgi:hypothetical protein
MMIIATVGRYHIANKDSYNRSLTRLGMRSLEQHEPTFALGQSLSLRVPTKVVYERALNRWANE